MVDGGQIITPGSTGAPSPAPPGALQGHGPAPAPAKINQTATDPAKKAAADQGDTPEKRKVATWVRWAIGWVAFLAIALGGVYIASLFQEEEVPAVEQSPSG